MLTELKILTMSSALNIPAEYRDNHYSTKLWRGLYNYLVRINKEHVFIETADELRVPAEFLLKDDNWISDKFLNDFMIRITQRLDDPDVLMKAGAATVSPEAMNPVEYNLLSLLLFPFLFFSSVVSHYRKFNQKNSITLKSRRPGKFIYSVQPKDGIKYSAHVCKNMTGVLNGIDTFFRFNSISVKHERCIHLGHEACEFEVKYKAQSYYLKKFSRLAGLIGLGYLLYFVVNFASAIIGIKTVNIIFSTAATAGTAILIWTLFSFWNLIKNIELYNNQAIEKNRELAENYRRLDKRFHESNLLRELSLKLLNTNETRQVLRECLLELKNRFGYARGLTMLLSANENLLYTSDVLGFKESQDLFKLSLAYPAQKEDSQFFATILATGNAVLIENIAEFAGRLKTHNKKVIEALDVTSLIAAPLQDEKSKYGLLVVGSIGSDRPLNQDDLHIIENVARLISLSFQNARNFENEKSLRVVLQKFVPAVTQSGIDVIAHAKGGLQPKNSDATAIFIDLRGFTSLCESMPPERALEMLNIYMNFACTILAKHGIILDKLVGDAIVAYITPSSSDRIRHARKATLGAIEILARLPELDQNLKDRGFPELSIGIGIHSGEVILGVVGCDLKADYTPIGDTMNVASRLQSLTKEHSNTSRGILIISETSYRRANMNLNAVRIGEQLIRGRANKEPVYLINSEMALAFQTKPGFEEAA